MCIRDKVWPFGMSIESGAFINGQNGGAMKKMGEMLMAREPFSEIVMGNTALVRAMIESGDPGGDLLSGQPHAGDRPGPGFDTG